MTEHEHTETTNATNCTTNATNRTTNATTRTTATDRTMEAVDHTHPDTGRPFGERVAFARGPTVAADGGDAEAADGGPDVTDGGEERGEAMRDVDHTPPTDAEPNRVFERGREGRDGDR